MGFYFLLVCTQCVKDYCGPVYFWRDLSQKGVFVWLQNTIHWVCIAQVWVDTLFNVCGNLTIQLSMKLNVGVCIWQLFYQHDGAECSHYIEFHMLYHLEHDIIL